mgnify:CR=1 FL=1
MPSGTNNLYNRWALNIGRSVNLSTPPTVKMTLHTSGYTANQDTHEVYADLTNELPTANGYTSGGITLTGVTWSRSGAIATFDCSDPIWTVVTANLVARTYAYRLIGTFDTLVDPLIGWGLLDSANVDVTTTPGNTLTVTINASGLFTVTRT